MSGPLTPGAYAQLVDGDIAWLEKQPRTLEREHVIEICRDHVRLYRDRVEQRLEQAIRERDDAFRIAKESGHHLTNMMLDEKKRADVAQAEVVRLTKAIEAIMRRFQADLPGIAAAIGTRVAERLLNEGLLDDGRCCLCGEAKR